MKIIAFVIAAGLLFLIPTTVSANSKPKPPKGGTVTLTNEQFMYLLSLATKEPAATPVPLPSKPGDKGDKGDKGDAGGAGATGPAGAAGDRGADGPPGKDGEPGRDGVGFAQGVVFLVNGACPAGTTVQGPQNRWTVYANDTTGRPWTTTGSSAQLFLSACQVN